MENTRPILNWKFWMACLTIICLSCSKELENGFYSYEKMVVVDGVITDQEEFQEIKLSYTSPIDNVIIQEPLSNASVWVETDNGVVISFNETTAGTYKTQTPYKAIQGVSYKLIFELASDNGKRYESNYELMPLQTEIESVNQQFTTIPSTSVGDEVPGIQFFIDTKELGSSPAYFRYEWNEGHRIIVPYPTKFYWKRGNKPNERVPVPDTCYTEARSRNLILTNTTGLDGNRALEVPVRFIPADTLNLSDRYSIEVVQYSMSEQAYSYFNKLREFTESTGSLFDKQQGTVIGNMISFDNPSEVVLGYFEVSSVSRLRKFFNISELDSELQPYITGFSHTCRPADYMLTTLDSIGFYNAVDISDRGESELERMTRGPYRIYDWEPNPTPNGTSYLRLADCVNCTRFGKLEKPAYWIE